MPKLPKSYPPPWDDGKTTQPQPSPVIPVPMPAPRSQPQPQPAQIPTPMVAAKPTVRPMPAPSPRDPESVAAFLRGTSEVQGYSKPKYAAIETEYDGYRFRSRLEAKWAVFFDAMGIVFDYEPEGFEFDGTRYLPDFYLPEFGVYVEIKPYNRSVVHCLGDGNKWERKCSKFRDCVGKAILICYGDPAENTFQYLFAWDSTDGSAGVYDDKATFKVHDGIAYLVTNNARRSRDVYVTERFESNDRLVTAWQWLHFDEYKVYRLLQDAALKSVDEPFEYTATDKLNSAKRAARQARFEHGEKPRV